MRATKFGRELTELIIKHYPGMADGDPLQIGEVAATVADTLGGCLALLKKINGGEGDVIQKALFDRAVRFATDLEKDATNAETETKH